MSVEESRKKNTEELAIELQNNRIKNSARNLLAGLGLTIITAFFPLLIRTLIIRTFGERLLGLSSVMNSTVLMLNMAELGLGSVMVYFIYEPAAHGNIDLVNRYLNEIRKLYFFVAGIIIFVGAIVFWVTPNIVGGNYVDGINVKYVYIIHLISVCIPYLLWGESGIVLIAYQKKALQHTAALISNIIMYFLQIYAICIIGDFNLYVLLLVLQSVLYSSIQHFLVRARFPELKPIGTLNRKSKRSIRMKMMSMIGHQLDEKLLYNIDNLFVSVMLGLKYVSLYGNYLCVVTALSMIFYMIYDAILSGIGNALIVETIDSNKVRFDCVLFMSGIIAGWTTLCMVTSYQHFMELWMPGLLISNGSMICFCILSYTIQMRRCVQTFKSAAGMWENDKLKPYVSMVIDIILNAVLIPLMGISGAVISSVICIGCIELPWETKVLYHDLFKAKLKDFIRRFVRYNVVNLLLIVVVGFLLNSVVFYTSIAEIFIKLFLCTMICIVFYFLIYRRDKEFTIWKDTLLLLFGKA